VAAPTITSVPTTPAAPKRPGWWKTHYPMPGERKEVVGGYLFVAPTTLLLLVFYFIPLIQTFYYSFTKWNPISTQGAKSAGLSNYRHLTSTDDFLGALGHTFELLIFSVPIAMAVGLVLALLLNRPFRGRTVYRTLVFIPYIAPMIGTAYIFEYMLSPLGGVVNGVLGSFGVAPINFLNQNPWAMISIIAFTIWYTAGFNMVIYLAALGSVPEVYYEASIMDGASWWARFRYITWPMIWPSTLFLLVIGVINTIQAFTQIFALTAGGPLQSTYTIIYWIYQESFVNLNGGLATAGSVVLFVIGMIVTVLQLRFLGRRNQILLG
jgi:ABC-type sugar transport system permease subunit